MPDFKNFFSPDSFLPERSKSHIPVMLKEVLHYLAPQDGKTYVDATFGEGGYSEAILEQGQTHVFGVDRDPQAHVSAQFLKKKFPDRFEFLAGNFADLEMLFQKKDFPPIEGIVFDLGVSSPQLDQPGRGFSFQKEGPLDMRMEQEGLSAREVINTFSEKDLADIFYYYGDETKSRKVAHFIVKARGTQEIQTTLDLANIIHSALGRRVGKIDSATRVFQALRIYVNDELGALEKGLKAALKLLNPGGHLVVVTFHSLEDRIVKDFFKKHSQKQEKYSALSSSHNPSQDFSPSLILLTRRVVHPDAHEISQNPRSRSAKLRAVLKIEDPLLMREEI